MTSRPQYLTRPCVLCDQPIIDVVTEASVRKKNNEPKRMSLDATPRKAVVLIDTMNGPLARITDVYESHFSTCAPFVAIVKDEGRPAAMLALRRAHAEATQKETP